jgi:hypothetical protein
MAGFKRGGSRGGAGGAYKKSYAKKRAASDDEEGAPQASKKTKGDSGEDEDSAPFAPELKTDDDGQKYIGVSMQRYDRTEDWLTRKKLNASGKRRVIVREFKDNLLIDIREFWTNDGGELKPGKKVRMECLSRGGPRMLIVILGHLFEPRPIQRSCRILTFA